MNSPFRRDFATASSAADGVTVTLPFPANAVLGDWMIADFGCIDTGFTQTGFVTAVPSGWGLVQFDAFGPLHYCYCKRVQAVEPANYSWTLALASSWAGGIAAYGGVHPTVPIADVTVQHSTGGSNPTLFASATANNSNALILASATAITPALLGPFTFGFLVGATLIWEKHQIAGTNIRHFAYDKVVPDMPPGPTGIAGADSGGGAKSAFTILLAAEGILSNSVAYPLTNPGVQADYDLLLRDSTGSLIGLLDEYQSLRFSRVENNVGAVTLVLPDLTGTPQASSQATLVNLLLQVDTRLEVWRSFPGFPAYLEGETQYFFRHFEQQLNEQGEQVLVVSGFDANHMLERRSVFYNEDGTVHVAAFGSSAFLLSLLWDYNVTFLSDPTRDLSAYMGQSFNGTGINQEKTYALRKLLDVMREISDATAQGGSYLGFDVVWRQPVNPQLSFLTFPKMRGVDHRYPFGYAPVLLDPEAGNLLAVTVGVDYSQEVNTVWVAGQGDGMLRLNEIVQDTTRSSLSPLNRMESVRNATSAEDTGQMDAEGNAALREGRPRQIFSASVNQIPGCIYGIHYKFGDLVTLSYKGNLYQCRVAGTDFVIGGGRENIGIVIRQDDLLNVA